MLKKTLHIFAIMYVFLIQCLTAVPCTDWRELFPTDHPSARAFASMTFDPATEQLILFGGLNRISNTFTFFNETWNWNGSNWILLLVLMLQWPLTLKQDS